MVASQHGGLVGDSVESDDAHHMYVQMLHGSQARPVLVHTRIIRNPKHTQIQHAELTRKRVDRTNKTDRLLVGPDVTGLNQQSAPFMPCPNHLGINVHHG